MMPRRAANKPVRCIQCKEAPRVEKRQFRDGPWAGLTGWRVFCAGGKHNAQVAIRAHKADAITDWNKHMERCAATGADPAKMFPGVDQ
jgi:hypothetical protein